MMMHILLSIMNRYILNVITLNGTLLLRLWGYVKERVFIEGPVTVNEPQRKITQICNTVTLEMLTNVQKTWINHLSMCGLYNGEV